MYGETGLIYPYFQNFSQEVQFLEEFSEIQKASVLMSNLVPTYSVVEYDLGEGDLFKAPEPIIEEPVIDLDPMSAAFSMISCGKDVISPQTSIQSEHLLNEVFYECEKDLLGKSTIGEQFSEVSAVHTPSVLMEDPIEEKDRSLSQGAIQKSVSSEVSAVHTPVVLTEDLIEEKDRLLSQGAIQKSISSEGLSSMDWIHGGAMRPNFLDFQGLDFEATYGMRRAFSEGDIQKTLTIGNYSIQERMQRISRYRTKKTKRNFGRTIKDYYPERLRKMFLVHVPSIFMAAWKIVYPFIDNNTKKKHQPITKIGRGRPEANHSSYDPLTMPRDPLCILPHVNMTKMASRSSHMC